MGKIKEVLRLRFEPTILSCARARVVSRVIPCRVRFPRVHPQPRSSTPDREYGARCLRQPWLDQHRTDPWTVILSPSPAVAGN
jgi:hypothetical protein